MKLTSSYALPTAVQALAPDDRLLAALNELYEGADTTRSGLSPAAAASPTASDYADDVWNALEDDLTDEDVDELLSEELRQERLAHTITRANAEQARRIADCARDSLNALLRHLDQPFATVDRNGTVTQWNSALAELSGIAASQAVGKSLVNLLRLPAGHALKVALRDLSPTATYAAASRAPRILDGLLALSPNLSVSRLTLIPLHHVPGTLEAIVVLFSVER